MENKFFLKSVTIIGAIVTACGAFGITLPFTTEEAKEILVLVEKLVGLVLVIYGRVRATQPLGFFPKG